jgi:hypothetical protein
LLLFAALVAALGGAGTGLVLLQDSWLQLLLFFPLLLLEGINLHLTSIRGCSRGVGLRAAGWSSACWGPGSGAIWRCSSGSCRWVWHSRFWACNWPCSAFIWAPPLLPTVSAADRPARCRAGLLEQAGTHLTQRRWRLVGHGADGRTQLPDRTPPVPEHATTAPEQGASACAGALPVERRTVHRNVPTHRLVHRGPLSQSGRSRRSRLVPVPDRRAAARSITLTLAGR